VFGPGTVIAEAAVRILEDLDKRREIWDLRRMGNWENWVCHRLPLASGYLNKPPAIWCAGRKVKSYSRDASKGGADCVIVKN
jgi:hypothetical protein